MRESIRALGADKVEHHYLVYAPANLPAAAGAGQC